MNKWRSPSMAIGSSSLRTDRQSNAQTLGHLPDQWRTKSSEAIWLVPTSKCSAFTMKLQKLALVLLWDTKQNLPVGQRDRWQLFWKLETKNKGWKSQGWIRKAKAFSALLCLEENLEQSSLYKVCPTTLGKGFLSTNYFLSWWQNLAWDGLL